MLVRVLEALVVVPLSGRVARPFVPPAAVLVRVREALEVTVFCGRLARPFVPLAAVLVQMLEAVELTVACGNVALVVVEHQGGSFSPLVLGYEKRDDLEVTITYGYFERHLRSEATHHCPLDQHHTRRVVAGTGFCRALVLSNCILAGVTEKSDDKLRGLENTLYTSSKSGHRIPDPPQFPQFPQGPIGA